MSIATTRNSSIFESRCNTLAVLVDFINFLLLSNCCSYWAILLNWFCVVIDLVVKINKALYGPIVRVAHIVAYSLKHTSRHFTFLQVILNARGAAIIVIYWVAWAFCHRAVAKDLCITSCQYKSFLQ